MLYRDCIEKLLQLKDVIVTNIECQGREMHIWLRMEQRMYFCPCCGTITGKVHDYRTQLVKDISISGYDTILHLRKRRHVCPECGKRFDERIDFLPRYRQFTNRVSMQIFEQLKECRALKVLLCRTICHLRQQPVSSMKSILKQASSLRFWLSMSSEEMQRARNSSVFSLIRRTGGS